MGNILKDALAWYRTCEARRIIRSRDIPPSTGPDGPDIYQCHLGSLREITFKVKRAKFDGWNSLYTFQGEEDIRQQFFYPYLPCNFIDAGCCLGSWTLPALAMGSTVYGFEPDNRYLQDLAQTIALNGFPVYFFGFPMALFNQSDAILKDMGEIQNVQIISLDDFCEWNNIKPDYVKIDVEGMEKYVVEGGLRTFEKFKPKVMIENHEWVTIDMSNWIQKEMESIGYRYHHAGRLSDDIRYSFFD